MRLVPIVTTRPASRDLPTEGMRGLAAAAVYFGHILLFPLDPGWSPPSLLRFFETGQAAVLVFFILSGYVIGLTNAQSFDSARASDYLRRRLVRLVPINTIGVALAIVAAGSLGMRAIVGNLTFVENDLGYFGFVVPTLTSNPNLWSLNYEAVCYICFLAVWRWPARPAVLFIVLGLAVLPGWWLAGVPRFVSAYAAGLVFWFAGLALAWLVPRDSITDGEPRAPWPAALLLALVTWKMNFLGAIVHRFGLPTDRRTWVCPDFLDFLPVGVWLVALVTQRKNRVTRSLPWFAGGWLAANFTWRAARGTLAIDSADAAYLALFAAGLGLLAWRPGVSCLARLAPFGAISFGFYAFAAPVQRLTAALFPTFSGGSFSFAFRLIACTSVALVLAWLAEHQLQPFLRQRLLSVPAKSPGVVSPTNA